MVTRTPAERLYEEMVDIASGDPVTPANIVIMTASLMQVAQTYKELTGQTKKKLVIDTIRKFVVEETDGEVEEALLIIIDTTLPTAIDVIMQVDKKKLAISLETGCSKILSCSCLK